MADGPETATNWMERPQTIPRVSRLGDLDEIIVRIGGVGHIMYRHDAERLALEIQEAVANG